MALEQKTLSGDAATVGSTFPNQKQVSHWDGITVTFGTNAAGVLLDYCAPVGFNQFTNKYVPWTAPDAPKLVVSLASATEGTFTITVGGVTTGDIAYNATATAVKQALYAIGVLADVTLDTSVYTIVLTDQRSLEHAPTISGTVSSITGGSPTAVATAGTATYGANLIKGFVWSEKIQLNDTTDVQGVILVKGRLRYEDIADTVASEDISALQAELRKTPLGRGIIVEGLVNQH